MPARTLSRFGGGIAATALCLSVGGCESGKAAVPAAPPPLEVEVAVVSEQSVTISSEWIATLDGYVNAQIRPQVSGYLLKRNYDEGAAVGKGDVLFEIDPRPFNAALAQARAQLAQAEAQLAKNARDVERDTPLAEQQAIAQSQLDTEIHAHRAAQANVEFLAAGVEAAELNVGFTKVTSLIDGVAAIATAQIGDLVGPTTLLTTVSQVSPIKAYFAVLMTSFAFILGTAPLWMATGSGGASRRVLGTVVITGTLAATAIAIFVIPMLFVLMERLASRFVRRRGVATAPDTIEGSA